jgi:LamB porin
MWARFVLERERMRAFARVVLLLALAIGSARAQPEAGAEPPTPPAGDPPTVEPVEPVAEPAPPVAKPSAPVPTPTPAPAADQPMTITGPRTDGFRFGSYGRLLAGTDLRGGKPVSANVVAHGPRVVEPSYLELELSYGLVTPRGLELRPVVTLAFDSTLFHDTGDFDAQPALRNLYLDAQLTKQVRAWAGSRMYRGDDIYLFDYWPLDDQNTVGGGLSYHVDQLDGAIHAGVNRLNRDFQFQEVDVSDPEQGAATVVQLDRQRLVLSGTASYVVGDDLAKPNFKIKVHGEVHSLGSGTRKRVDGTFEELPSDSGYLVGFELGSFGFADPSSKFRRHVNLFVRYASGLAAFDELAPPTSFGSNLKVTRASELTFGASANWDLKLGNVMFGALSRRFIDADGAGADEDDGWEYALDVRPLVRVVPSVPELFVGADLSYQARFPRGLNAITQRAEDPAVFQIAPMLVFSPMGPSAYDRPQLRLVYRAAVRNDAALHLYVPGDVRGEDKVTHFLGVQAEWWFNSTTYH